jgi:CubicO group peptidase (beta-lactamase class C family)
MNLKIKPKLNYYNKTYSINDRMDFYKIPGTNVVVIKDFKLIESFSYGVKNIKTNKKIDGNTLFQAASISKCISSLIVFRLIEKGLLKLDKDVSFYLKNFDVKNIKGEKVNCTIKQLLSHTGGLSVRGFPGYSKNQIRPSINQILKGQLPSNTNAVMQEFKPNEFNYSGGGYTIIQKIIEDVTKKKFEEIAKEEFFTLFDLKYSTFSDVPKNSNSCGHKFNKKVDRGFHKYPEKCAAGFWTNPKELSKIFIEIANIFHNKKSKFLTKNSIKEIFKPITKARNGKIGLGFFLKKSQEGIYFKHNGWNEGFQSKFIFNLNKGYGFIVMTNSDNGFDFIDEIFVSLAKKYNFDDLKNYDFY